VKTAVDGERTTIRDHISGDSHQQPDVKYPDVAAATYDLSSMQSSAPSNIYEQGARQPSLVCASRFSWAGAAAAPSGREMWLTIKAGKAQTIA